MMCYHSGIERAGALHVGVAVHNRIYTANVLGSTFVDDLLAAPLEISGGYGTPPYGSGLGIELDKGVIEKYAVSA